MDWTAIALSLRLRPSSRRAAYAGAPIAYWLAFEVAMEVLRRGRRPPLVLPPTVLGFWRAGRHRIAGHRRAWMN